MARLSILDVHKSFGRTHILHGVSLEIEDGEFVALVGPSGCGKSTLLRMIAGLEDITTGHVAIGPRIVNELAPKDRDVAMVFQSYALYPHRTVYENMAFSLRLRKVAREEVDRRVRAAADVLNLSELLERLPRQLSGGQRQRVAMGRAIVRDPQVFLFDEPLSNLDAKLRVQMRVEIKALHQRLRTTTVYVTHDQVEAMTMADRIVVMRDGVVEQVGSPLELYDRPANTFVAAFIGSPAMNLLEGETCRAGNESFARLPGSATFSLSTAVPEQPVVVGVRPEHWTLRPPGEGLEGQVKVVEPTGAETQVVVNTAAGDIKAVFAGRHAFSPGQAICLRPQEGMVHLFDRASARRL